MRRISSVSFLFIISTLFAMLATLTLLAPHWLELLGFDPDGGDGAFEVALTLVLGVTAVVTAGVGVAVRWIARARAQRSGALRGVQ